MTEAEKRECESLGRQAAAMGCPLMVPPSLHAELVRQGVDTSNIRPTQRLPLHR